MKIKNIKKIHSEKEIQFYDVVEANPYHNFLIKCGDKNIVSHNCSFEDEVNKLALIIRNYYNVLSKIGESLVKIKTC